MSGHCDQRTVNELARPDRQRLVSAEVDDQLPVADKLLKTMVFLTPAAARNPELSLSENLKSKAEVVRGALRLFLAQRGMKPDAMPTEVRIVYLVRVRSGLPCSSPTSGLRVTVDRMEVIEAEFNDGVLRPVRRLPLRPGERVGIVVVRRPDPLRWDLSRLSKVISDEDTLTEAGLVDWETF